MASVRRMLIDYLENAAECRIYSLEDPSMLMRNPELQCNDQTDIQKLIERSEVREALLGQIMLILLFVLAIMLRELA